MLLCLECSICEMFLSWSLMVSIINRFASIALSKVEITLAFIFLPTLVMSVTPLSSSVSDSYSLCHHRAYHPTHAPSLAQVCGHPRWWELAWLTPYNEDVAKVRCWHKADLRLIQTRLPVTADIIAVTSNSHFNRAFGRDSQSNWHLPHWEF